MKINSRRCRTFKYVVTTWTPCAVGLDPSAVGRNKIFFDCLVVTVDVEPGDVALGAEATHAIRRIVAESAAACVVIRGSAQLVSPAEQFYDVTDWDVLSRLADVLDVLTLLAERLEEYGERVHLVPFGWKYRAQLDPLEPERDEDDIRLALGLTPS